MGLLEVLGLSRKGGENVSDESTQVAEKENWVEAVEKLREGYTDAERYVDDKMFVLPRFLKTVIGAGADEPAKRFADFYESIWADGNLPRKFKELIFTALGVATTSPRCIVHVIPAIRAGATDGEIFEAVAVGFAAAGFYPNNPGIPYAFEYAVKVLDIAQKFRNGEEWEYLPKPKWDHGVG